MRGSTPRFSLLTGFALMMLALLSDCTGIKVAHVTQTGSGKVPGIKVFSGKVVDLPPLIELEVSTEAATERVKPEAISRLFLEDLHLKLREPVPGDSFDFLTSIEVYAEDRQGKPMLLAVGQRFAQGATEISLQPTGLEISELIFAKEIMVSSKVRGYHPPRTLKFDVEAVFIADVDVAEASCDAR